MIQEYKKLKWHFFKNRIFYLYFYFNFKDEREDVQKKTFAKWINSQLTKVSDLFIIETLPFSRTIRSESFMIVYVTAVYGF